jgi:hypothetical protein
MAIPESQFQTWSHQGSVTQSSDTYHTIKNVLEASSTPYAGKNFEVFLQGSYGNDTNIYAESDVDIVIRLDECFHSDLSELSDVEKDAYQKAFSSATYTLSMFKQDVLSVLNNNYGSAVHSGSKAIAIDAGGSRRKTDVIVSCQYRKYVRFISVKDFEYTEGICFFNSQDKFIANYPKQHSENMTSKHQQSSKILKPMVRILKNMRGRLVDNRLIKADTAPSYYIEGLLYNTPTSKFTGKYQSCFCNILNWYLQEAQKNDLVCANEQYYLLREGNPVCWNQADCDKFINSAVTLWNEWNK